MDFVGLIKSFFSAIAAGLGLAKQRDSEKNAPDVKAAAIAQDEQNAQDKTRKAIASKDIEEERRELAE
jgi:patatin-like phospholipase/acyl hydrolase